MGKQNLSDEERERRRQQAIELNKKGTFGGVQGGGRKKHKRASQIVAEKAQEKAHLIVDALEDAISDESSPNVRLKAAKTWIEIEQKEAALQIQEEQHYEKLQEAELISLIVDKLERLQDLGIVPAIIESRGEEISSPKTSIEDSG